LPRDDPPPALPEPDGTEKHRWRILFRWLCEWKFTAAIGAYLSPNTIDEIVDGHMSEWTCFKLALGRARRRIFRRAIDKRQASLEVQRMLQDIADPERGPPA
jgi:hypothetical protein